MIRIEEIIERAEAYVDPEGIDLLRRAYAFSAKAHAVFGKKGSGEIAALQAHSKICAR